MSDRFTLADIQSTARIYDGRCLSKEYLNNYTPLKWMCKRGHTWDSPYSIIQQGGWCYQCIKDDFNETRFRELKTIAKKHGGKLLSSEYKNSATKLKWQCSKGH